jgi:hypothetical protein
MSELDDRVIAAVLARGCAGEALRVGTSGVGMVAADAKAAQRARQGA